MKKLPIPVIKQDEGSQDCGLACLAMVLGYYGKDISIECLKKHVKIYEGGIYSPQLGIFALENGYKAEIITHNPGLFTLHQRKLSQKELLKYIKQISRLERMQKDKDVLQYFMQFMKLGGKVTVKIPDGQDIQKSIAKDIPPIALFTNQFLNDDKGIYNFHFNVVKGFSKTNVYLNDPAPGYDQEKFLLEDFLFGLHASSYGDIDNGSLLKIMR